MKCLLSRFYGKGEIEPINWSTTMSAQTAELTDKQQKLDNVAHGWIIQFFLFVNNRHPTRRNMCLRFFFLPTFISRQYQLVKKK